MRKTIIFPLLALLTAGLTLHAQDVAAPDYAAIRQQITDSNSQFHYPKLMERFEQCDTTLVLEEYRALYYGFPLSEDFIPYHGENKKLLEIRKKILKSDYDTDTCDKIIRVAKEALLDNPFDLTALSIIPICYQLMDSTDVARVWEIKVQGIVDAICSSGDGETAETAYHVINIEHEYEILNRRHLELNQVLVEEMPIDHMTVQANSDSIAGIYFNFGACSDVYREKYK